jgi:putative ABC transport system permease protein
MSTGARLRSRLRPVDAAREAALGLRSRAWRASLSAFGIAVGIAAAVAVLGISDSSRADLLDQLGAQGNLLTVSAGRDSTGSAQPLPLTAEAMVGHIPPVQAVTAVGLVNGATVRRTAAVPTLASGGISVMAAEPGLPATLHATLAAGVFLNAATARYPAVVLGYQAATTLGISTVAADTQVYVAGHYFTVVGILNPVPLAQEIDEAALIGFPVAQSVLGESGNPTELYLRAAPDQVQAVASVLPFSANPVHPEATSVIWPSSLLAARLTAKSAFTGLFLGLGAVAVFVGGVGIANIMVISVLERRSEIGLRRALGATRRHVAAEFFTESLLLSAAGGLGGVLLGAAVTVAEASARHQRIVVPPAAVGIGIGVAVAVGALAGVYPAARAARLSPTEALRGAA